MQRYLLVALKNGGRLSYLPSRLATISSGLSVPARNWRMDGSRPEMSMPAAVAFCENDSTFCTKHDSQGTLQRAYYHTHMISRPKKKKANKQTKNEQCAQEGAICTRASSMYAHFHPVAHSPNNV